MIIDLVNRRITLDKPTDRLHDAVIVTPGGRSCLEMPHNKLRDVTVVGERRAVSQFCHPPDMREAWETDACILAPRDDYEAKFVCEGLTFIPANFIDEAGSINRVAYAEIESDREEIEALVQEGEAIRNKLRDRGIVVKHTSEGVQWQREWDAGGEDGIVHGMDGLGSAPEEEANDN